MTSMSYPHPDYYSIDKLINSVIIDCKSDDMSWEEDHITIVLLKELKKYLAPKGLCYLMFIKIKAQ